MELSRREKKYQYLLKYYHFLINKKNIDLVKIRQKQLKASYDWAKKYNFAILPIYDPIIPKSFQKNFDEYFNINQKEIICKINLLLPLKNIQITDQKLEFQKNILNRFESIYQSLTESILSFKSYQFSPYSYNNSNIVYYIQNKYKIPFVNYSWLEYFELYHQLPLLFKNKILNSLHINELYGLSISSLFYYLQIFHKNIKFNWNATSKTLSKNDLFGYYQKYNHSFKINKDIKYDFINFESYDKDLPNMIKKYLTKRGIASLHINLKKIEDLNDSFYQNVYQFSSHFKKILLFRSQWALTKNNFFIIGIYPLNKQRKINMDLLKNHINKCLLDLLNQYQFEIEKYYFIYQNEKSFGKKNLKLIEENMIERKQKWCQKMKLDKVTTFF